MQRYFEEKRIDDDFKRQIARTKCSKESPPFGFPFSLISSPLYLSAFIDPSPQITHTLLHGIQLAVPSHSNVIVPVLLNKT